MVIEDIIRALKTKEHTVRSIVSRYLERIAIYDDKLNSLADLNKEVMFIADILDQELQDKGPRGPLHGVPIVIKDNILTKDTMRTTVNSRVFENFYAPYDAHIVRRLRAAGAVILAKGNCSEFAYFMAGGKMPSGYGSMHGQVKHPFDQSLDPLGSSTGSAVSVAADLTAVSIGTETNGSLMSPAQQNGVVSIKPTVGLVSRHGIVPISLLQDTAGPMGKTVKDVAIVLDVITGKDEQDIATLTAPMKNVSYASSCDAQIRGKRIGLINFTNHPNNDEEIAILNEAKKHFENEGITCVEINHPYDLPNNGITLHYGFKRSLNAFLSRLGAHAPVQSLSEIIQLNRLTPKRNLRYGQHNLLRSEIADGRLNSSEYLMHREKEMASVERFKALFKTHEVDAIITPKVNGFPPVGGLPCIIVPAKKMDSTPRGLILMGLPFTEEKLLPLAHYYEQNTHYRTTPNLEQYHVQYDNTT